MLNKIKIIVLIFIACYSVNGIAKETSYIRDYSYQASDTDSKVSARNASILFLKQKLLSEIGTIVGSNVNIFRSSNGVNISSQKIQSLTEGFIKTEVIEEKWNGVTFYVKAKLIADPHEITEKLKSLNKNQPRSENKEFEYWKSVVSINSKDAYQSYIRKYPKGKYHELAVIGINNIANKKNSFVDTRNLLMKESGILTLVVRHDVGTLSDLDGDDITQQLGTSAKNLLKNYVNSNVKFKIITDFDESEPFQFNHKKQSQTVCYKNDSKMVAGAMLADHEDQDGQYRRVRVFIYDCKTQHFKLNSFVPTGSSSKDFWREDSIRKNLRLFIRDYLDSV